jgi:phosphoserine phosphatase
VTDPTTILCRVHGLDRPGITAGLMEVLAATGARLFDVEQVVVRGRLTLDLLFGVEEDQPTVKDLLFYGWQNDLHLEFDVVEGTPTQRSLTAAVTMVARSIGPEAFGAAAMAVAEAGGNIDRIVRLSRYPVVSYELIVADGDLDELRRNLGLAAAAHSFDVAVQEERLERRNKRMVVIDVDSTLIEDEVIDLLAAEAGVQDEVVRITHAAMEGEIDFETALRRRVALLAGLETSALERVAGAVRFSPGARTFVRTLRRLGMKVALVSGGFTAITDRLGAELEVDAAVANQLEVRDGVLTGALVGEIVDRPGKARILSRLADEAGIPLEQVVAVGDGANDLDMLGVAGLGIAFNARRTVREAADASLNVPYLDAILFLLGLRREDVEDRDDPVPVPVEGLPPV